jgi:hypothetical protein
MSQPPPIPPNPYPPLPYATAIYVRPGLLTALGICSIVVGGLSALGSFSSVASGIAYLVMAHVSMGIPLPAAAPSTQPTTAPAVRVTPFQMHINPAASALTITEGVLSLGAAIVLIIAGSMMLRDNPTSWRMHRIYVLIKFPLIVVGAFAMWWVYTDLFKGMMTMTTAQGAPIPGAFMNAMAAFEAVFMAVISLIYPVTLLIVLKSRTSQSYLKLLKERIAPAR